MPASALLPEYVDESIGLAQRRRLIGDLGSIICRIAQEICVGYEPEAMRLNVAPRKDLVNPVQGVGIG